MKATKSNDYTAAINQGVANMMAVLGLDSSAVPEEIKLACRSRIRSVVKDIYNSTLKSNIVVAMAEVVDFAAVQFDNDSNYPLDRIWSRTVKTQEMAALVSHAYAEALKELK